MPVVQSVPPNVDSIARGVRVLEIGAGTIKRVPHAVTLDVNPLAAPDVLHDLDETPYPFPANSFDIVIAEHVLEHVEHVVRVVEEPHRIVAAGGVLLVEVPPFSSANVHTDPRTVTRSARAASITSSKERRSRDIATRTPFSGGVRRALDSRGEA